MSELNPAALSLEDETPQPDTSAPAPEASAAPLQNAQPAEDPEPEGTVVNPGGEKLVPLGALAGAREKVREKEAALAAKDAEIAQLREKAQKFDQVAGEWNAVQPLIQQLKSGTYQPPQQQKPVVNERALQYAKDLDLYKTDGTPDVDRAQRILDYNAVQAKEQAQQLVQPIYQQTALQQSQILRDKVAATPAPNGVAVDRAILNEIWSMVPPEMSARPEVAAMLWRQALADTVLQGKYKTPTTAPAPVVETASLGGSAPAAVDLTAIDRRFIEASDIKPDNFRKTAERYKPGAVNSLE